MHLGRWGGLTVRRYIADAMDYQVSQSAKLAAQGRVASEQLTRNVRSKQVVVLTPKCVSTASLEDLKAIVQKMGTAAKADNDAVVQLALKETQRLIDEALPQLKGQIEAARADELGSIPTILATSWLLVTRLRCVQTLSALVVTASDCAEWVCSNWPVVHVIGRPFALCPNAVGPGGDCVGLCGMVLFNRAILPTGEGLLV